LGLLELRNLMIVALVRRQISDAGQGATSPLDTACSLDRLPDPRVCCSHDLETLTKVIFAIGGSDDADLLRPQIWLMNDRT
jgi:hypothetical protein